MYKQILKNTQPIVYRVLNNLMTSKNFGHAFLIVGQNGTPKTETAFFIAQSILCNTSELACETCNNCIRVKENNYADLMYFDGLKNTLKKEDVIDIKSKFSLTPLEENGKKIYIIDNIDKSSISALNSLLKFLEEPSEDTIAIFTCESIEKVLSTIVSRCQIIYLKNPDVNLYMNNAIDNGINNLDAYLISNIKPNYDINGVIEDEDYQIALVSAKKFLMGFNDLYGVLYYIQKEIFTKDSVKNIKILTYMLDIISLFFIDTYKGVNINLDWYSELLNTYVKKDYTNVILLLIEAKDKLNINNFNVSLVLEQMFYKVIEEVNK